MDDFDFDLLHGPAEYLADLLGCSVRTVRRYKSGSTALPEPCRRLLRLRRSGDLAALLGSEWDGFYCNEYYGLLHVPGFRNGLSPGQVRAMFFGYQELSALRIELRDLRGRVAALRSGVDYLLRRNDAAAAKRLRHVVGL